jgi:hypothetical protein
MNAEGTKRLHLIKSLVREQGADGDKCWLIVQLETEALEAGVRISELEALFALQQIRMAEATRMWQAATGKQDVLPDLGDLLAWLMARPAALEALARELRNSLQEMCDAEDAKEYFRMAGALEWAHITIARADKALAGEPGEGGERSYSAAEVQVLQMRAWKEGVIAHRRGLRLSDGELTTEAARLYPEKPQEVKP